MGKRQSGMNCTRSQSSARSTTSHRCRTWIAMATRRNRSGRRLAFESSTRAARVPSRFTTQSMVRIGSPKTADAILKPTRGLRGLAGIQFLREILKSAAAKLTIWVAGYSARRINCISYNSQLPNDYCFDALVCMRATDKCDARNFVGAA